MAIFVRGDDNLEYTILAPNKACAGEIVTKADESEIIKKGNHIDILGRNVFRFTILPRYVYTLIELAPKAA